MKKEVIKAIRIMGVGTTELLMDFSLGVGYFDSIEWIKSDNRVVLHMFAQNDFDLSVDWDDLTYEDKLEVFVVLRSILYN